MDRIDKINNSRKNLNDNINNEQKLFITSLEKVFSTDFGIAFGKYLIKYCQVFTPEDTANTQKMFENSVKRKVYLELIRPYLSSETRIKLEQ